MNKVLSKEIKVNGMMSKPSTMHLYPMPLKVFVTNDDYGCSLSVGTEITDVQYTIPMEQILKILKELGVKL